MDLLLCYLMLFKFEISNPILYSLNQSSVENLIVFFFFFFFLLYQHISPNEYIK